MRVVVTGATGNVGTAVVRALASDSAVHEVIGIARRPPGPEASIPDSVRHVCADITMDDLGPHFEGADSVVHLAWLFQPTHKPLVTWRGNVLGTLRVMEASTAAAVTAFVHASSIGAYSAAPPDGHAVDESWPTHSLPTAAYGREKAYVERLLDAFEREQPGRRVVRLRPAFVFQRAAATEQRRLFAGPFVPNAVARRGRLPFVPMPAGLRFQAVHADDLADAYRRAVVGEAVGAFNIAADPVIDADGLAAVLATRSVPVPRRVVRLAVAAAWHLHLVPADPALLDLFLQLPLLDCARARHELGWEPQRSAYDAIGELVDGVAAGAGGPTEPLAPDRFDRRMREIGSGVGQRC